MERIVLTLVNYLCLFKLTNRLIEKLVLTGASATA